MSQEPRDRSDEEKPPRLALFFLILFPFLLVLIFGWFDGWFRG